MKVMLKITRIVSAITMLVAAMAVTSCQDTLSLNPISEISNASFWNTEDDAWGGLYGMYARFRGQAQSNLFLWGEARSEMLERSLGGTNNYERYYQNSLDRNFAGPAWQGLYTVVHDANLIIKHVPNISFTTEAEKHEVLAQAHAMRAYAYFVMVRTWGRVPLVTEPTEGYSPELTQRVRTPINEIFTLIKQDINQAIEYFPTNNLPTGRLFWSKPAAQTLKADVHLWTSKREGGGSADAEIALTGIK